MEATATLVRRARDPEAAWTAVEITQAVNDAANTLINTMPSGATIAILNIQSADVEMANFVFGQLEYNFFRAERFTVVSRASLEQIMAEQGFHLSGFVGDASAVSIGNMLGASIVITGDISGTGALRRLMLRAIDVQTAQILAIAQAPF